MKKNQEGFGIIEVIVGLFVGSLLLLAFANLIWYTLKVNQANIKDFKAQLYLKELIEIAKDLEQTQDGWLEITTTTCTDILPCYPQISGTNWNLVNGSKQTLEGIYERWLKIEDTADSKTKKVTALIEWNNGFQNKTMEMEIYVYNYSP